MTSQETGGDPRSIYKSASMVPRIPIRDALLHEGYRMWRGAVLVLAHEEFVRNVIADAIRSAADETLTKQLGRGAQEASISARIEATMRVSLSTATGSNCLSSENSKH